MDLNQNDDSWRDLPEPFEDLLEPARYKVYYGGRGSAKSWSFATVLLAIAARCPLRILCAREIQLSIADSVKRLLDDRIDAMGLGDFYTSTNSEIVGANGSVFLFAGLKHNITKGVVNLRAEDRGSFL